MAEHEVKVDNISAFVTGNALFPDAQSRATLIEAGYNTYNPNAFALIQSIPVMNVRGVPVVVFATPSVRLSGFIRQVGDYYAPFTNFSNVWSMIPNPNIDACLSLLYVI